MKRHYEYTTAEAGQSCRICYRTFAVGEIIKVYEGYKRVCISTSACVAKVRKAPTRLTVQP